MYLQTKCVVHFQAAKLQASSGFQLQPEVGHQYGLGRSGEQKKKESLVPLD